MNIDKTTPTVKTGENPCKRFTAIVNQAGTAAPTTVAASILENSLTNAGTAPTWARSSAGLYTMTITGGFSGTLFVKSAVIENGSTGFIAKVIKTSANVVTIQVMDGAVPAAADLVGNLFLALEIWPS